MDDFEKAAIANQKRGWEIIDDTNLIDIWKSINADVRLVGSLRMGLLMKNKDIDFQAISKLSAHPSIKRVEYTNLIDTEESCIEWHAWYHDSNNEIWQIDMTDISKMWRIKL